MKKLLFVLTFVVALTACSSDNSGNSKVNEVPSTNTVQTQSSEDQSQQEQAEQTASDTEQTVTYLGEDYTLPGEINNIVAASLESMEDAAMLGIKPVGVLSIGDAIPEYLATELEGAALVGDKFSPNLEAIVGLDPDVILGTSKFDETVASSLNKIQTHIPYSHISTNWEANLLLLGQLTNKESEAQALIDQYYADSEEAKAQIGDSLQDKLVLIIRIRQGAMNVYPAGVYLNPVLYETLGTPVPEVIQAAEAQAALSLEALADANPDYIFLQFETSENSEQPAALDDLLADPIFQSIEAAKNDHVFINAIHPLAQGGTAWSKIKFLEAAIEHLTK